MTGRWVDDENAALLTDLYQLTMLDAYHAQGMRETAVFDFFVRRLPSTRNYLIACGLDDVLAYLETLRFSGKQLDYLRSLGRFSPGFLERLADFRFTGDVYAVPEGTPMFANEPILEVVAPIAEGQLIETLLMNQLHVATMAASKAARVVVAARDRAVVDFGLRRMHGADAGIKAARAFYIAGVQATSNVLAGALYGIPVSGTAAHSYVLAHESEYAAFRSLVQTMPQAVVPVDTYDTIEGVRQVIRVAGKVDASRIAGIRLDSGDMVSLAIQSRLLLDNAGLTGVKIFASSSLDEYAIHDLLQAGAPIDGFGVGSHMGVSADAPFLDCAYKLVEYAGKLKAKRSPGKHTLPGRKQVFRQTNQGKATGDVLASRDEGLPGTPLLAPVMIGGKRVAAAPPLPSVQAYCREQIESLPSQLLQFTAAAPPYPVAISSKLEALTRSISN